MGTKLKDCCLDKAADDEPIFVIRAQDITAPDVVLDWLERNPQISETKRQETLDIVSQMRNWKFRKRAD